MTDYNILVREKLRNFRFIHFSIIMGSIGYGMMMAYIYKYSPIPLQLDEPEILNWIFYGILVYAIIAVGAVKVVRQKSLASPKIFTETEAMRRQKIEHPPFFGNYMMMLFIIWTILEVIAIGGVLIFLLSGDVYIGLVFVGIAVFLKMIHGPKYEELSSLAAQAVSSEMRG